MSTLLNTQRLTESIAEQFRAVAEPARLQILFAVQHGEQSVTEIADVTGLHPANVSKHLQYLHQQAFVDRRRRGSFVYYSLSDDTVSKLCDVMYRRLEAELRARRYVLASPPAGANLRQEPS